MIYKQDGCYSPPMEVSATCSPFVPGMVFAKFSLWLHALPQFCRLPSVHTYPLMPTSVNPRIILCETEVPIPARTVA